MNSREGGFLHKLYKWKALKVRKKIVASISPLAIDGNEFEDGEARRSKKNLGLELLL